MLILAAVAAALTSGVLGADEVWRIGWLDPSPPPTPGKRYSDLDAFRQALGQAGYVEGPNFVIEGRFADARTERLPALAKELVDRPVGIIAMIGTLCPY